MDELGIDVPQTLLKARSEICLYMKALSSPVPIKEYMSQQMMVSHGSERVRLMPPNLLKRSKMGEMNFSAFPKMVRYISHTIPA